MTMIAPIVLPEESVHEIAERDLTRCQCRPSNEPDITVYCYACLSTVVKRVIIRRVREHTSDLGQHPQSDDFSHVVLRELGLTEAIDNLRVNRIRALAAP